MATQPSRTWIERSNFTMTETPYKRPSGAETGINQRRTPRGREAGKEGAGAGGGRARHRRRERDTTRGPARPKQARERHNPEVVQFPRYANLGSY